MSDDLSLRLDVLDRQIVDSDGVPVGRIDDLVLGEPAGGDATTPTPRAILTGAQALGERIGGTTGRTMARVAARLRPHGEPQGAAAIELGLVDRIDEQVRLTVPLADLPHVAGLEHWLARHVVGPMPGSGDARE